MKIISQRINGILMYTSTVTELRAWVENPAAMLTGEPVYHLCEIVDADRTSQNATVRVLGEEVSYIMPFSALHTIHTFHLVSQRVTEVHGEPQCKR